MVKVREKIFLRHHLSNINHNCANFVHLRIEIVKLKKNRYFQNIIPQKADNRVVSLSCIGWLNFADQFQYYNWLILKKYPHANCYKD